MAVRTTAGRAVSRMVRGAGAVLRRAVAALSGIVLYVIDRDDPVVEAAQHAEHWTDGTD